MAARNSDATQKITFRIGINIGTSSSTATTFLVTASM
jgi:hypothetical protein